LGALFGGNFSPTGGNVFFGKGGKISPGPPKKKHFPFFPRGDFSFRARWGKFFDFPKLIFSTKKRGKGQIFFFSKKKGGGFFLGFLLKNFQKKGGLFFLFFSPKKKNFFPGGFFGEPRRKIFFFPKKIKTREGGGGGKIFLFPQMGQKKKDFLKLFFFFFSLALFSSPKHNNIEKTTLFLFSWPIGIQKRFLNSREKIGFFWGEKKSKFFFFFFCTEIFIFSFFSPPQLEKNFLLGG